MSRPRRSAAPSCRPSGSAASSASRGRSRSPTGSCASTGRCSATSGRSRDRSRSSASMYVVFTEIANVGDERAELRGLHPVRRSCCSGSSPRRRAPACTSLVARENLLRKMRFPRIVDPAVGGRSARLFNLGMTLVAVFIFALANGVWPTWSWLELIPLDRAARAAGDRRRDAAERAVRPLPRRAADLGGRHPDAVLRLAGALRGDDGAGGVSSAAYLANPIAADPHPGAPRGRRPDRPVAGHRDRRSGADPDPAGRSSRVAFGSGLCVFMREAPRIVEEL